MSEDQQRKYIERHCLYTEDQWRMAAELKSRVEAEGIHLVRLAWADSHGHARAKALSVSSFIESLANGYNINVATWTLDASGGRVFKSFVKGGGMGLEEMTGSPNLVNVPQPETFRVLPWAPGVGWIMCDQYFTDGRPFHFSSRRILKEQVESLRSVGKELIVGIEAEWYLAKLVDEHLADDQAGIPGEKGRPPRTAPPEPGFSYHSESNMDIMQPVLSELAGVYEKIGLPLRSIENEWGAGQLECTFSATTALAAADNYVLFRTATRQVCRRLGYLASFMARPALRGYYASGWHLHQSVTEMSNGANVFMSDDNLMSPLAGAYLAGLLENAAAATVFATPTVNGYRRFQANSLAPDRATWGVDHRGTMIRMLGGAGDPATRFENRLGEPSANPYLFIASQIASGLDGVERNLNPGAPEENPYEAEKPMLPHSLADALLALDQSSLFRARFGDLFVDYYLALKRAELERFMAYMDRSGETETPGEVTQWEQNEYFDFF
jgi:glutamine synthetase